MNPPVYHGPTTLADALALAEEQGGIRLALSVPYGAWIAVSVNGAPPLLRRVANQSGQSGSVSGTGEWSEAAPPPSLQWRPG